jgi:chromosome partitioning protein
MLVSINHQKGGTGKSTICFNLAALLQKIKNITLEVVDLDVQQTITLNNYTRSENGLKPFNVRTFNDLEDFKNYISTDNDSKIILVDTGGFDSSLNRAVALYSDLVITPVSDSFVELQGLKTYEKVLQELSSAIGEPVIAHVLLNNVDPRRKNFTELKDFINKSENFKTFESIINRRVDFKESIAIGKSVVELDKNSKASTEIETLIKEVKKVLGI